MTWGRGRIPVLIAAGCATCTVLLLATGPGAMAASAEPSRPRVMGGTPALGSGAVAAIIMRNGDAWSTVCSAALWKPRILLTAAHCLTKPGSGTSVDAVKVFPPGIAIEAYSNVQPNASPVAVQGWWRPDGYVNTGSQVSPNDIAAIVLASDLAPSTITRLATTDEVNQLATQRGSSQLIGYGQAGPGVANNIPNSVTLPVTRLWLGSPLGDLFLAQTGNGQDACPGDSGSPVLATTGTLLLGNQAGAGGPCFGRAEGSTINLLAMAYLPVLNSALVQASYAPIPSAPQAIKATGRNRDVTVAWSPPQIAPEWVVGYDVVGAGGSIVCQSATTTCRIQGLPDATYGYTVRARNREGEGDAPISTATATIAAPSRLPAPWTRKQGAKRRLVVRTLAGTSSAVVTSYEVRDQRGRLTCTFRRPAATRKILTCPLPTLPGRYRFQVRADTEMGTTRWSPASTAVIIR